MTTTLKPVAPARPRRSSTAGRRGGGVRALRRRETRSGYAFLALWLIGFFGLTVGPMIASLYLAFTDFNLFDSPHWLGLDNFRALATDPRYLHSVQITLIYVFVGTPIKLAAALAVAVLLNVSFKGVGFYRSAFFAPSLVGASVSIAVVWRSLFSSSGTVVGIQESLGIDIGPWAGNPDLTMPMMILLAIWTFGSPMVIFLAGLKQIPKELYEAASVDGAGPVSRFFRIGLPSLTPVIFFNLLIEVINAFQVFTSAYIIGGSTGAPAGSTAFYTVYLYMRGFTDFRMGYASAMAWVLTVVVGIVALLLFKTSKSWVYYAGDDR